MEIQEAERCDEKEILVTFIKKNIGRLKNTQLDGIQIRLVLARQFKKLRVLFGVRKPNKEFEEYFKVQFGLTGATYRFHINYLELLDNYKLFPLLR
jgi:hypothetical protein